MVKKFRPFGRNGHMKKMVVVATCLVSYVAWPYVALYQIGDALQRGDAQTLTGDIAWASVREGLQEDIADQIIVPPGHAAPASKDALAPFGSGFMTSLAGNMVDRIVTPWRLAESLGAFHGVGHETGQALRSAWFLSPTRFEASFQVPPKGASAGSVRVQLELVYSGWGFQWRITRLWIPTEVLEQLQSNDSAATRT
jgi:hypothetical protein